MSHFINIQYCYDFLINQIPSGLLIYAHIPTAFIALLFGIYLLSKSRSLSSSTLFIVCVSFAVWCLLDISTWFSFLGAENTMFTWSLLDFISLIFFFFSYYFLYTFTTGKDLPIWQKILGLCVLLPTAITTLLGLNLTSFDANTCEAVENELVTNYLFYAEAIFLAVVIIFTIGQYRRAPDPVAKRETLLAGIGVSLFLLFFFLAGLAASILINYENLAGYAYNFEIYGLFGMPVLLIYLGYLIVRYHAFDLRVFTAQALSVAIITLVATQYAFLSGTASIILNTINLVLVAIVSVYLTRNVKKEISLREELAVANEKQQGLIHFISHQIKGYLTKSKAAFSGILEGDYGQTSPGMNEMVKMALADNDEGVATIKSILDASNLKKGTTEYKHDSFDFRQMIENQIASHTKEAKDKGLSLEMNIGQNENYTFIGDAEQLGKHVIGNIIDNSIKYTQTGGLEISLSKKDGKILFSVKDTGVGISDEDKKRLFTEGGRGKDSVKVNVNSTGYGLFIAKEIVAAHGGKIWAESEGLGKGSTFFVELPAS